MSIVNEEIAPESLSAEVRQTFIGGRVTKELLRSRTQLYKFTDRPLVQSTGTISPWWSSVNPIASGDPGLSGILERAERLGVSREAFARARSAVTQQWNSMSGLTIIQLLVPAYGFVGRCSSQLVDNESSHMQNVVFIGGAWQVYLPNLAIQHIIKV